MNSNVANPPKQDDRTINVRVMTTSGNYPDHGHEKVPVTELLQAVLQRAAAKLNIVDSSRWVVSVKGAQGAVATSSTYADLGLQGEVKLDWGPDAAGGG